MTKWAIFAAAVVAGAPAGMAGVGVVPRLDAALTTGVAKAPGVVSVADFGAVGDGKTDCTEAFLRAIKAATKASEHGATVVVPPGRYVLTGTLELRRCLLMGLAAGGWPADAGPMPEIEVRHTQGPAILARDGASVHGLSFNYGHGKNGPIKYPPTILLAGNGISITNVRIHAAWDGIIADGKSNIGRLNVENVFMPQLLHCGMYITRTYDIPTVRNVEVWVPNNYNITHEGVGFRIARNDGLRMSHCFAFNCATGFLFEMDEGEGGGGPWAQLDGCGTDACARGIVVKASGTVNINGGKYLDHFESLIVDDPGALVSVTGVMMQSNGAPAVVVRACRVVTLTGCQFWRAFVNNKRYLVELDGGEAAAVSGCSFSHQAPGIRIGPDVKRATVVGNIFQTPVGQPTVTVAEGQKGVVVIGNVADVPGSAQGEAK